MKITIKWAVILLASFLMTACIFTNKDQKTKKSQGLGQKNIKYYSNKSVSSLEVPPDLTKPDNKNAFRLDEHIPGLDKDRLNFSGKKSVASAILKPPTNILVKKSGELRWLVVDKKPDAVWNLSRNFLKNNGFAILKSNKKIGLLETDFLENRPEIPKQSLNFIRAALQKVLKARYALPILDKYRIRIEPFDNGKKSEVYLSLLSMEEVITNKGGDNENTIWQSRPKDISLETEMLYRLMLFLGSDDADAKAKILNARQTGKITVGISKDVNGFAKLTFSLNQIDTWRSVGWAFDQLGVAVSDKDIKEGSFYINTARTKDKGILSRIFGDAAIKKSFQILVKQISNKHTEVYFNDLSEQNKPKTIEFSREFLANVAKQF